MSATEVKQDDRPYATLLKLTRLRPSKVEMRTLEEEADSDRGRVLYSAPFRRLQNKAQVFSLETNAAIRSRLTHSLEVSSIGRYVAQQALKAFSHSELEALGIANNERPLITFVETACLLHDLGNPPFGHFGEIAISDWFHLNIQDLRPKEIGGETITLWNNYSGDFAHFDGNPQGFRIATRLQASETADLNGLNLTVTTLAATLKYPWSFERIGSQYPYSTEKATETRKKAGFFRTEEDVFQSIWKLLGLEDAVRHPLVFLMEAADDIAYCLSDIEDGVEKGLVRPEQFAAYVRQRLKTSAPFSNITEKSEDDVKAISRALERLQAPCFQRESDGRKVERLTPMQDFRAGVIRFLASRAGRAFKQSHADILSGTAKPLLRNGEAWVLLKTLTDFAESSLYNSPIVRQREITAHAVLAGLLDAYKPVMNCKWERFQRCIEGERKDAMNAPIARESSLVRRIAKKYQAVYAEALHHAKQVYKTDPAAISVMERIYRIRLILDHITGMTDEYALESFRLISGMNINPHRS